MNARPLIPIAVCYTAGILLGRIFPASAPLLLATAGCFLVFAWLFTRWWQPIAAIVLVLCGWTNLSIELSPLSPIDLRHLLPAEPQDVILAGILEETPSERMTLRRHRETAHTLAKLRCHSLKIKDTWQPVCGTVIVSTPGELGSNYFAGLQVTVSGIIREPAGAIAPGLFDYRQYLRWQGIYYQMHTEGPQDWTVTPPIARPRAVEQFYRWARAVLARGLPEDEALRLIWAMALGWVTALTGEVSEPFMRTGTLHIFAISGLHIALIAWVLARLLQMARVPRGFAATIIIPVIWFYTAATGWQASAIRSTIMSSVIVLAWSLKRPTDLLTSLTASALLILLWQPQQLFQASFQLSFFVVLSMALFLPPIQSRLEVFYSSDPLLPPSLIPRFRKTIMSGGEYIIESLAISIAATLGSLPLIAYYFSLITPVTLIANLFIVPLSSLTLICNVGSLLCGNWAPLVGILFNHTAWVFMWLMVWLCDKMQAWPAAYFYVPHPTIWGCVLYYAVVIGALTGLLFRKKIRRYAIALAILILAAMVTAYCRERSQTALTVLPGRSGSIVVRKSGYFLFCPGDETTVQYVTKPFLRSQGISSLDHVILTGSESQDRSGLEMLQASFKLQHCAEGPLPLRGNSRREGTSINSSDVVGRGQGVGPWTVLHPDANDHFSRNADKAIVLKGNLDGWNILLLSDLGRLGQRALGQRSYDQLGADIVVASIPSDGEPLNEGLLESIHPKAIVICCGDYPATARPSKALRERLKARNVPVFYTHETGAITLAISSTTLKLETMHSEVLVWKRR